MPIARGEDARRVTREAKKPGSANRSLPADESWPRKIIRDPLVPEPEVRAHRAAHAIANFGFKGALEA
jgi:hypothetical protein